MENNRNQFENGGRPLYEQPNGFQNEITPSFKGYSIAALVLGIIGIVCCCSYIIGGTCAVLALVFSIISRKQSGHFDGMALSGLILAIIGLVLLLASILCDILLADLIKEYEKMLNDLLAEMEAGKVQGV